MLRLLSLSICATILTCALAQSSSTATVPASVPVTVPATVPTPTTTSIPTPAPTSVPEPSTTPIPPEPENPTQAPQYPANYSYSEDNVVCIRLAGNMTLYIEYLNTTGDKVVLPAIDLDSRVTVDQDGSTCKPKLEWKIVLGFDILGEEAQAQFLNFTFQKADKVWNSSDLIYSFELGSLPPDVDVNTTSEIVFTSNGLFDVNVDEGGSYLCNALQNITFNSSSVEYKINATLSIENLQVQAFMDADEKGQFGTVSQDCASDQGNKIVPIAVGAALAGLVIVVLIAYLIGRLKSRRQNSYEALS